jgi:hypothetical protein
MNLGSRLLALSLCCGACSDFPPTPQPTRQAGSFAQRLLEDHGPWRTFETSGASVLVKPDSLAHEDIGVITKAVSDVRLEVLKLLEAAESRSTSHFFFVNSRDDIRRFLGSPTAGFIQGDEPTGVFMYNREFRLVPLLRHELTHLYTFEQWGRTEHGPWLTEGVAIWAASNCQGHSADELAAGVLARGTFVPLKQLSASFRNIPEDVAMSEAGSIVSFLVRRDGLAAMRDRWGERAPQLTHPLGQDGETIEAEWLTYLKTVKPATLDIARGLREGC